MDENLNDFLFDDDLFLPDAPGDEPQGPDNLDEYLQLFGTLFEPLASRESHSLDAQPQMQMSDFPAVLDFGLNDVTLASMGHDDEALQSSLGLNQRLQKLVHHQLLNVQKSETELQAILVSCFHWELDGADTGL